MLNFKFANFQSVPNTAIEGLSSANQGILLGQQINGDIVSVSLGLATTDSPTFENLTLNGNLTAKGNLTYLDTNVSVTSALTVENNGTGPAIIVNQTGAEPIADFRDDGVSVLYINDGGNIGISTTTPGEKLSINGNISTTGYLSGDSIKFNTGAGIDTPDIGELTWSSTDESLHVGLDAGVTLTLGQDLVLRVKANETIKKGQVVYAVGAAGGGSSNILASLFSAVSGGVDELYTLGIAAEDMATNDFGFITTFGKVKSVHVSETRATDDPEYGLAANSGWVIGTILYPSAVQAGRLTQLPPAAPNRDIPMAMILSENGNQRTFFVRYEHGYHLDELHDVRTVGVKAEGDLLTWNNSVSAWENRAEADPVFTTWAQANSANYDSVYTTVSINSAGWDGGTLNYQRWSFTGDGVNDTFNIAGMVEDDEEGYRVYIDTIVIDPIEYQIIRSL